MEISIQQESLRTERRVGEANRSCQVEGRLGLPGGPPLGRIQSGHARIRDLRAVATTGRVQVEGLMEVELNYLAPSADPEQMALPEYLAVWTKENGGALAFAQEMPLAGVLTGTPIEAEANVAGLSIEPIDANSLRCQASLDLSAVAAVPQEIKVAVEAIVTPSDRVEVVKEVLQLESLVGKAAVEVPVNTILALPEVKPDIVRVIARTARLTEISVEAVRGRVIVSGRLDINAIYISQTADSGQRIEVNDWGGEGRTPIGFEAFVDLAGLGPEVAIEPRGTIGRLSLEAIGPREVRLDASVLVTVKAVCFRQVPLVTELIPGAEEVVDLRRVQVDCLHLAGQDEQELTVESTLELPPGKPGLEHILQTRVNPVALAVQTAAGKCLIDGWLDVSLFYLAESTETGQQSLAIADWTRDQGAGIPVADVVELPEARPDLDATLSWRLGRVTVEQVAPRMVRLTTIITVKVKTTERKLVSAIVEAAAVPIAPMAGRPSMLFYVVQPGDTLWGIARHYTTTVEALVRTNKIADPEAPLTGQKILIPRSPVAV